MPNSLEDHKKKLRPGYHIHKESELKTKEVYRNAELERPKHFKPLVKKGEKTNFQVYLPSSNSSKGNLNLFPWEYLMSISKHLK